MWRICSCARGGGWENRTGLVHDCVYDVDICSNCGGVVPPKGGYYGPSSVVDLEDLRNSPYDSGYVVPYDDYCRKARKCSKKGEHSDAIEFYRKAYDVSWHNGEKCRALALIADEYEAMGDCASAEECWERCCAVEDVRPESIYRFTAGRGDFLYRRGRYEEAIGEYSKSLKVLNGLEDKNIHYSALKCYVGIVHFIIDSYYNLGDDGRKGEYHNELKRCIGRYVRSRHDGDVEVKAHYISKMATDIVADEGWGDEALILIDYAIGLQHDCPADFYNIKAMILEYNLQYEEALKYYDRALSIDNSNETFLKNRAVCEAECIISKLKLEVLFRRVESSHLDLINKALKMLPQGFERRRYLNVKAEILDQLGEPVKAEVCRALAVKHYDEVDEAESQLKWLKSGETYINITGIQFYRNFEPFGEGTIVDLISEEDNPHDRDAIRVEVEGETVGYVANSKYTLIKEVKSATEIKNSDSRRAEVQFILFRKWVIARLI